MWRCRSLANHLFHQNQHHFLKTAQNDTILRYPFRSFCATTSDQQPQQQQQRNDQSSGTEENRPRGVYGRLTSVGRHTTKMDIVNFFQSSHLKPEDVKFAYNRLFNPLGMLLQFPSRTAFSAALRLIAMKGRYLRLTEVDHAEWSNLESNYDGRALALQGISWNTLPEDVERFFSGCNVAPTDIRLISRQGRREFDEPSVRFALVTFPTIKDAANVIREKNRSFCLNNCITIKLLQ